MINRYIVDSCMYVYAHSNCVFIVHLYVYIYFLIRATKETRPYFPVIPGRLMMGSLLSPRTSKSGMVKAITQEITCRGDPLSKVAWGVGEMRAFTKLQLHQLESAPSSGVGRIVCLPRPAMAGEGGGKIFHPDKPGGSAAQMEELKYAYDYLQGIISVDLPA